MGAIDGTLFKLHCEPSKDKIFFYCRKKFSGLTMQASLDSNGRFTSYEAGWPATGNDITVLEKSRLWATRLQKLEPGEYWLVDKGYRVTPWTVPTYTKRELRLDQRTELVGTSST